MATRYRLTSVDTVTDAGSWLFTASDGRGEDTEVVLVPCELPDRPPVEAWVNCSGVKPRGICLDSSVNRCTHEDQRLYRGEIGAILRDGGIVCPKHGSIFDACSGYCDNGEAAESTLLSVDIELEDGQVYLTDENMTYLHDGPADDDDDDDGPQSTSHLQF